MLALPGVCVFIAGGAVKLIEAERIFGEVGGDPVQQDPNTGLMELIYQIHEVVRGAETAGGRKIAGTLIPPGGVQRMLSHRHQLYVGKPHFFHIGDQIGRNIPVAQKLIIPGAPPGPQMDLIDIQRLLIDGVFSPPLEPVLVAPLIA